MDKFEIAELINNLKNRVIEIESRFHIRNEDYHELWLKNTKLALGIDDEVVDSVPSEQKEKI